MQHEADVSRNRIFLRDGLPPLAVSILTRGDAVRVQMLDKSSPSSSVFLFAGQRHT